MEIKIIRETKKALHLSESGKDFWVQRRWLREDGTLTPKGEAARAAATAGEKTKKTPFYKIKFRALRDVSEKAVVVECFDGSSDVLPKSQIRDCIVEDAIWIPCWLAEQKKLQFSNKKIWLES